MGGGEEEGEENKNAWLVKPEVNPLLLLSLAQGVEPLSLFTSRSVTLSGGGGGVQTDAPTAAFDTFPPVRGRYLSCKKNI